MKIFFLVVTFSLQFLLAQTEDSISKKADIKSNSEAQKTTQPYAVKKSVSKEQVDALKLEVLSQKTQAVILKDLLKKEGLDGTQKPMIIEFKSRLSDKYLVDSVLYKLNGEVIYQYIFEDASSSEVRAPKPQIQTMVVPGPYVFEVLVIYRGNDTGVFSYLKDYRITREETYKFEIKKEDKTRVEVLTFEDGSILADFKDRPKLKISHN